MSCWSDSVCTCSAALDIYKVLQESAEALLQFLEASQDLNGLSTPLCLAAARALGRSAFHVIMHTAGMHAA